MNRSYVEILAAKLDPESAEQLRTKALEVFHPRIYRRSVAEKAFEKARALADVDTKTIASIDELEAAYAVELAAINEQLRQTVLMQQPKEPRRAMEHLKEMTKLVALSLNGTKVTDAGLEHLKRMTPG